MSRRAAPPARPRVQLVQYPTPPENGGRRDRLAFKRAVEGDENPCATCPGYCCELYLSLTVFDLARICVGLSVLPEELCHVEEAKEPSLDAVAQVDGAPVRIMLNSGNGKPCVFLHTMRAQRRCAIYELRPMTCQLYPFRWFQDGVLTGPKAVWCRTPWLVAPAKRRRLTRLIQQAIVEAETSRRHLASFARQRRWPRTAEGLLRFAIERGAAELGLDPAPLLDPRRFRKLGPSLW